MSNGERESLERKRAWAGIVIGLSLMVMIFGMVTDTIEVIAIGGGVGALATIVFVALSWAIKDSA